MELESEITVNTQEFPVDPNAQSNARVIAIPGVALCNPMLAAPVFTAKGKYAENVCFFEASLGAKMTDLSTNKIVYFNALPNAKTYVFKASAKGHTPKTSLPFVVPAGKIAAVCLNAKFNASKGLNYHFNFALGMSPPPASFCQ